MSTPVLTSYLKKQDSIHTYLDEWQSIRQSQTGVASPEADDEKDDQGQSVALISCMSPGCEANCQVAHPCNPLYDYHCRTCLVGDFSCKSLLELVDYKLQRQSMLELAESAA